MIPFKSILDVLQFYLQTFSLKQGLICDLKTNQMYLCCLLGPGIKIIDQFLFSYSRAPLCNLQDSLGTPWGLHVICEKIGNNIPKNGEFIARKFTGQIIPIAQRESEKAHITTRILRLKGMQWGINKGMNLALHRSCDTYQRCVYIHGTNLENFIPKPLSNGCLLLKSQDLLRLFQQINVGDFCLLIK